MTTETNYTLNDDWTVYDHIRLNHVINSDTHYVSTRECIPFVWWGANVPVEGIHYQIKPIGQKRMFQRGRRK